MEPERSGGGESRGEIWKKPMRALTKAAVNLQVPLTRGTDGNSLTACRILLVVWGGGRESSGSLEERLQSSVGGSIQHLALSKIIRNDSRRKKEESRAGAKVIIFLSGLCTQKHLGPALHFSRASCHYSQGYIEAS